MLNFMYFCSQAKKAVPVHAHHILSLNTPPQTAHVNKNTKSVISLMKTFLYFIRFYSQYYMSKTTVQNTMLSMYPEGYVRLI